MIGQRPARMTAARAALLLGAGALAGIVGSAGFRRAAWSGRPWPGECPGTCCASSPRSPGSPSPSASGREA